MPEGEPQRVLDAIRRLLEEAGKSWREVAHEPIRTAAEAARQRGTPLAAGAKTILFKADDRFVLLVVSADESLRSRAIRRSLGVRRTRFATGDELRRLTGLASGGVPPFGPPVLPFPLYADPSILEREVVAFTPGVRDRSFLLAGTDWREVARPRPAALT